MISLSVCAGCAPVVTQPLPAQLAGNDADAQMEFWHTLPQRKIASNDEAFHALLLFADGQDPASDYAGRVAVLKSRQLLPAGFSQGANDAARRGTLAVGLVRVLSIKGGVTMRLLGPSPRYAVRELQGQGLYPPSSPQQLVSGAELLGIIGRAEDYQRTHAAVGAARDAQPRATPAGGASK